MLNPVFTDAFSLSPEFREGLPDFNDKAGVYLIYQGDFLQYVGKSRALGLRVQQSLLERFAKPHSYTNRLTVFSVEFLKTKEERDALELEAACIVLLKPLKNRAKPALLNKAGAKLLLNDLDQRDCLLTSVRFESAVYATTRLERQNRRQNRHRMVPLPKVWPSKAVPRPSFLNDRGEDYEIDISGYDQ